MYDIQHILLVDGDAHNQKSFRRALQNKQIANKITICAGAKEALAHFEADAPKFDIVVIHHELQGMSGLVLTCRLAEQAVSPPIVFIVQDTEMEIAAEAMHAGADDYIVQDGEERYLALLPTVLLNVIRRKRMEEALHNSQARYRLLFEQMNDAAFILDLEGVHIEVNQKAADMLGYDREEMIGMSSKQIVAPSEQGESERILQLLTNGQTPPLYERTFRKKSGEEIVVELNVHLIRDLDGEPLYIQSIARDITMRKRTVEALRQSEERLRMLLEGSYDIVVLKDLEGKYLYYNGPVYYGLNPADVVGKTTEDFFDPETVAKMKAHEQKVITSEQSLIVENQVHWRDENLWFSDQMYPVRNAGGEIIGIGVASRNITKRKQTEQMLEKRTHALQTLHRIALDIGAELDMETLLRRIVEYARSLLDAQQGGCVIFAHGEDKLMYMLDADGSKTYRSGQTTAFKEKKVFQHSQPFVIEEYTKWESRLPSPPDTWTKTLMAPLCWQGQTIGSLSLAADEDRQPFDTGDIWLAEMFAAQAAVAIVNAQLYNRLQEHRLTLEEEVHRQTTEIRRQQEQTEAILHNIEDAIIILDAQTTINFINPAFTRLLGYEPEDTIGESVLTLIKDADLRDFVTAGLKAMYAGNNWRGEVNIPCKNGKHAEVAATFVPVTGPDGELEQLLGSLHDIGRFKQLDRMKTRFMNVISHELKTPLSNIRLYTRLLRSGKTEKQKTYLNTLDIQTERLAQLTDKILIATRFADADARLKWSEFSAAEIININIRRFKSFAHAKNVTLQAAPSTNNLPHLQGDLDWLTRALGELVENAIKFSDSGGEVRLSTQYIEGEMSHIAINVQDSGKGVPAEDLQKILAYSFERGEIGEAGHLPGVGLGLAIARMILARHGGHLAATSAGKEKGSTFTMLLPLDKPETRFQNSPPATRL